LMRQVAWLFLNTLSVSGAVGNLGYHLLHREAALDLLEEAAEAVFEAHFGRGGGARPVRDGRACIFLRLLGLGLLLSRACENSARYNRTLNFEACRHAQGKKMQKFDLRSALRPDQISFSHSLGQLLPIQFGQPCPDWPTRRQPLSGLPAMGVFSDNYQRHKGGTCEH
jgi:hypothetical protein